VSSATIGGFFLIKARSNSAKATIEATSAAETVIKIKKIALNNPLSIAICIVFDPMPKPGSMFSS
jgi:hypothetical protein